MKGKGRERLEPAFLCGNDFSRWDTCLHVCNGLSHTFLWPTKTLLLLQSVTFVSHYSLIFHCKIPLLPFLNEGCSHGASTKFWSPSGATEGASSPPEPTDSPGDQAGWILTSSGGWFLGHRVPLRFYAWQQTEEEKRKRKKKSRKTALLWIARYGQGLGVCSLFPWKYFFINKENRMPMCSPFGGIIAFLWTKACVTQAWSSCNQQRATRNGDWKMKGFADWTGCQPVGARHFPTRPVLHYTPCLPCQAETIQ